MSSTDRQSIIHKKAQVAREDFDLRAMSPAKAIRLSLARRADDLFGLAIVIKTLEQTRLTSDDLMTALEEPGMLMLLDGADDARGVAWCDGNFISAVIEQQISGTVRAGDVQPRSYTRTDAAMLAPLVDATLDGMDARMADHDPAYAPVNLRFGDRVDDTRALSLALDAGRYDLFKLTVDIAEGARSGVIILVLPERAAPVKPSAAAGPNDDKAQQTSMTSIAMDATIPLTAVIAQLNQPLNVICAFEPGMILPLPADCLGQAELVARPRHVVADVHLGQVNGMRAVRVCVSSDMADDSAVLPPAPLPNTLGDAAGVEPISDLPAMPELADLPMAAEPLADLPDDWSPDDDLPDLDLPEPLSLTPMPST